MQVRMRFVIGEKEYVVHVGIIPINTSMTKYIDTLLILAEASSDDTGFDAEYEKEAQVEAVLKAAAEKLGLVLVDGRSIMYSGSDREAVIRAYDDVSLDQLKALESLGSDIRVAACPSTRDAYQITFIVADGVEAVRIR